MRLGSSDKSSDVFWCYWRLLEPLTRIALTLLNEQWVLPWAPPLSQSTHRRQPLPAAVRAGDVHPSTSRLQINCACGKPPLAYPAMAYIKNKTIRVRARLVTMLNRSKYILYLSFFKVATLCLDESFAHSWLHLECFSRSLEGVPTYVAHFLAEAYQKLLKP